MAKRQGYVYEQFHNHMTTEISEYDEYNYKIDNVVKNEFKHLQGKYTTSEQQLLSVAFFVKVYLLSQNSF